jgi:hypothetical protein
LSAVLADGWSATYPSPPASFAPDSAPTKVTVSRAGFDASGAAVTVSEQLVVTARVRQPYPNQAQLTPERVALSDYVYSTDAISGAVNNSGEASPKPIANHVTPDRFVAGNMIGGAGRPIEIVAFHRNARSGRQVACAKCIISDGTNTISVAVPNTSVPGRAGDRNPVIVHALPETDISSLADGLCWCDWEVYPWVGGAASVAKSAENGAARREFTRRYFLKNASLASNPPFAYVSTTGSDAAGAVSTNAATAVAAPFLTVLGASNAIHTAYSATTGVDGAVIRIGNDGGTPFVLGSTAATRTQRVAALTIERDPGVPRANARVSFGAAAFRPRLGGALSAPLTTGALRFRDVSVVRTGTLAIQGETAAHLEIIFEDVDFDIGGINNAMLSSSHTCFYGATISNPAALGAGANEHRVFRGVSVDLNHAAMEGWLVVGCALTRPGLLGRYSTGGRLFSGAVFAFNRFRDPSSSALFIIGADADANGVAIVQNLFEYVSATSSAPMKVTADATAGNNSHVVLHHNSFAGFFTHGRGNIFYDEGATRRTSRLMSCKGNIHVQINTKGDVYRGANEGGADAPSATGNWPYLFGVGCQGEFSQFIDANSGGIGSSFAQAYPGLGAKIGTSATVRQDPLFVNHQGTSAGPSAGAGGGDYRLQAGSPAKAMLSEVLISHDLAGAVRSASPAAGAFA